MSVNEENKATPPYDQNDDLKLESISNQDLSRLEVDSMQKSAVIF